MSEIRHQKPSEPIKRFLKVRRGYKIAIEPGVHRRLQIHNESSANGEDLWANLGVDACETALAWAIDDFGEIVAG